MDARDGRGRMSSMADISLCADWRGLSLTTTYHLLIIFAADTIARKGHDDLTVTKKIVKRRAFGCFPRLPKSRPK